MVWVFSLFTTDVSTRCVPPELLLPGIRSLHRVGRTGCPPSLNRALPPGVILEAIPKYLSGRTSYRQP